MLFRSLDIWVRELGVPAMDAIRAATYWPSVMMKKDKDVGTVSAGKIADIIAVRGDVLRYIDLLQNFFFKTRWNRTFRLVRGIPIN